MTLPLSPLSHPLAPGAPVSVEGRLGKYVMAQHGPGTLVVLWSATGLLLADREEVTPLSTEADPSALASIASIWLFELGQVLGASEVHRLAAVQSGCAQAWLVNSKKLAIDRNDCEEIETKKSKRTRCFGVDQNCGNGRTIGGFQGHVENVEVGQPSRCRTEAHRECSLGLSQPQRCALQPRIDAGFHGQPWEANPAQSGDCGLSGKPS